MQCNDVENNNKTDLAKNAKAIPCTFPQGAARAFLFLLAKCRKNSLSQNILKYNDAEIFGKAYSENSHISFNHQQNIMKLKKICLTAISGSVLFIAGCNVLENPNMLQAGAQALKAVTLTNNEVVAMSAQSCEAMDAENKVAAANSAYTKRLNQLVQNFPKQVNGQTLNYKVYQTDDVNAWAMANGCVRVYTGLMDIMNDDELRGVIGHEIGHVALGHSTARMRTVYATSAARQAAAASGGIAATLSQGLAGELANQYINAQFSQANETAADNYSFDLLTDIGLERKGLVTAFQKLAQLNGGAENSSILSSHPPSAQRAQNIQNRIDQSK